MTIFNVTLRTRDGDDSVRTLRAALKVLLRRFGLRAVRVEEEKLVDPISSKKPESGNRIMNKRDALRLKPGDCILYGDHMRMVDCVRGTGFHHGRVLHVTAAGGIKVERLHPNGVTSYGMTAWVPYHHVLRTYEYDADAPRFNGPASGTCRT